MKFKKEIMQPSLFLCPFRPANLPSPVHRGLFHFLFPTRRWPSTTRLSRPNLVCQPSLQLGPTRLLARQLYGTQKLFPLHENENRKYTFHCLQPHPKLEASATILRPPLALPMSHPIVTPWFSQGNKTLKNYLYE
jgi:hypothetical protein